VHGAQIATSTRIAGDERRNLQLKPMLVRRPLLPDQGEAGSEGPRWALGLSALAVAAAAVALLIFLAWPR
jgi:hypothetical protein